MTVCASRTFVSAAFVFEALGAGNFPSCSGITLVNQARTDSSGEKKKEGEKRRKEEGGER